MATGRLSAAVIVVFLGPDGCGKSSVIDRLQVELSAAFSEVHVFHLRPRWGRGGARQGLPVLDPHNLPPRNAFLSSAKLIYLSVDYSMIFLWKWWAWATRSSRLTIFDRYYHDLLVDPRRYRYGAPMWLAKCFARLVPSPDLWILLDAPVEVIHGRKQEVSFDETARQRQAFRDLVQGFRNAHVIDATAPLEQVTRAAQQLILAQGNAMGGTAARVR
jgi:thymidylate kinase